ncbi:MAG: hypothetical protein NVSMB65_04860 [Chloroflexota bacterium]
MINEPVLPATPAPEVKSCCAAVYASDWARLLLGDSFHPGGLALTERLGTLLALGPTTRVLDVAGGQGTSAVHLARTFGCHVTAVDYSGANVAATRVAAERAGQAHRVVALEGDAERLPVEDEAFDAVVCECAFCTFPDKQAAAAEFARVLRAGGRLGLSDLTRRGPLPSELDTLLAWVACIADARPPDEYAAYLEGAGLSVDTVEPHDEALREMVQGIRTRLMGAQLLIALKKVDLPVLDLARAQTMARSAAAAVGAGTLGYTLMVASYKTDGSGKG